jgi:hypothetical protein
MRGRPALQQRKQALKARFTSSFSGRARSPLRAVCTARRRAGPVRHSLGERGISYQSRLYGRGRGVGRGRGDTVGLAVAVGVGLPGGVDVEVAVGVAVGVCVAVGVAVGV